MTLYGSLLTTIVFFSFTGMEFSRISYCITFTGTDVRLIDLYFPWLLLLAILEDIRKKAFAFLLVWLTLAGHQVSTKPV